ncbi:Cleavage polyadenylation factor subunit clp1 [Ceratobasidium sp. 370]|nr:Cleavage polyadenylation factor subunit clp1 [Ceratobasidium sp. 370]
MVPLINIHTAFEQMRVQAHRALTAGQSETSKSRPPRVLVLGPENSGKTSACKTWCNYAVRGGRGWCPTLINLDVAEGGWTIPGTISACPLSAAIPTCTPANPFGATATSAPTALSSSALLPIVYWFGHTEIKRNRQLIEKLIHNLADNVKQKFKQDHTLNASGFIIDSPAGFAVPGPLVDNKYNFVKTCVEAFDVNIILIMGNEKLNVELQRAFGSSGNITVLKVPKSGGVVELDYAYQSRVISSQIRAYFYGTPLYLPPSMNAATAQLGGEATEMTLSPFSTTLDINEIRIYKIGDSATRATGEMQPVRVDLDSGGLLHSVLALLAPFDSNPSDEAILKQEDVDFNPSIVEKNSSEFSEFFLDAGHVGTDSEMGETIVEAAKEEIKESMYVVKLLEMIHTVLEHEAHLFSSSELELLRQIQAINSIQQFLIARLVQRKRGKWHRVDHLLSSYQHDLVKYLQIPEVDVPRKLAEALVGLCTNWRTQDSPTRAASGAEDVVDLTLDSDDKDEEAPKDKPVATNVSPTLATSGSPASGDSAAPSFAEDTSSATPAQLLECFTLDELKLMAKRLKVTKTKQTRPELIKALLHSSSTQTTLPFTIVTKPSGKSHLKNKSDMRQFFVQVPTNKMLLQERRVRDLCNEIFGACFRLRDEVFRVLHLVSLVYFRSTQYSESESILLSAILATARKRNYPKYEYRRTPDVFETRVDMLRYMESLQLLGEIDILLGEGPTPAGVKHDRLKAAQEVIERWKLIWDRWNSLVAYLKDKPPRDRGLERFEDGHILTRVVYKAAHCFGLLKDYDMELKLHTALIRQTRWRRGKRGGWYDRMALVYTRYMGGGDGNLNKARDILLEGLNDELVHLGSRPKLLKRLRTLEKKLRVPPEEQYVGDAELKTATLTRIEGVRIFTPLSAVQVQHTRTTPTPHIKELTPDRKPLVMSTTADPKPQRVPWKGKSIWAGKEGEVNVETFALEHYATLGFKGLAELVDDQGAARRIMEAIDERERENETWCIGVHWEQFEREVLLEICLGGGALATICRLLAEEYGNRGGGVPDLFIWNHAEKTCKFVEVKGPGDNLSETQKVWIDVLLGAGVDVEVCRVYEVGEIPPLRVKKAKSQGRAASKGRASKAKRKSSDPNDGQEPDPKPEEEDEQWSSSEDGDRAAEPERQGTWTDQSAPPEDGQPPSESAHNAQRDNTRPADPEDDHQPQAPSPSPAGTSVLGKREVHETELDVHQEAGRASKRAKRSEPTRASTPTPARRNTPRPPPISVTPMVPAHAHTPTPKSSQCTPAPVPPLTQAKVKTEPLSPTISLIGRGSSVIDNARNALTQETTIPETPPPRSQIQHHTDGSNSVPTLARGRDESVTPIKKERDGSKPTTKVPITAIVEPTPKRKRVDSPAHTPAALPPPSPSASVTTPAKTNSHESNSMGNSIARSRTPRKRTCPSSSREGLAASPKDWEKKWPDVFPKWIGDLGDESSDKDYEPSQRQSQSESQ